MTQTRAQSHWLKTALMGVVIGVVAAAGLTAASGVWRQIKLPTRDDTPSQLAATAGAENNEPVAGELSGLSKDSFGVSECVGILHEGQAAIRLTFTEPLAAGQALDKLIKTEDRGHIDGRAANAAFNSAWIARVEEDKNSIILPWLAPRHQYVLNIGTALRSKSGKQPDKAQTCELTTQGLAPSFFFASKGTVLPPNLNGGLPVVSVNVDEVDVQFLRVAPEKLSAFIDRVVDKRARAARTDEEGEASDEDGENNCAEGGCYYGAASNRYKGRTSGWDLNSLRELSQSVFLGRFKIGQALDERKTHFLAIENLPELRQPGIYVAVMSRPGQFEYEYQVTYFYISDVGLHARRQLQATDVFTTSLKSGQAISGAEIEVLDAQGKVLQKASSNGDGHATLAGLADKAALLLARKGKDTSIIALKEPGLDLGEFEIGGHLPRNAKLFAWAGRDLYRPGEKFTVSLLARNAAGQALPAGPIQFSLKKPNGDVATQGQAQPNAKLPGYLQQEVRLPADAPTGKWQLTFRADPAAKVADTVWEFQVEEFLPERMKLSLKTDTDKPLTDDFSIDVQGDYLYGAPAAGNRLLGNVAVERARNPLPKAWPGFVFGNVADTSLKQRQTLDEDELDSKGHTNLTVDFPRSGSSPLRVRASLSLLESGGRPVVRSVERTWWPANAIIAVRPAFDRDVTQEGALAEFEVARVRPDGQFAPLPQVPYTLVREIREYYWRHDRDRGWHSGYTTREETVLSDKLALTQRSKLSLPVDWGTYRLDLQDPQTKLTASYRFYAGWNAQDAESLGNRPDRVRLELSNAPVKLGDSVQVNIQSPHDGEALIMVEADRVLWQKRLSVSAKGSKLSIPIDKSWDRSDLYISAIVFRPGSQGDRITPARAVGLAWLPIARQERKLQVELNAPARGEPNKRSTAHVKIAGAAGKNAFVTVSAVDVGILNISNYKSPDPFDFFFGRHRFGAELSDIYGKLIERMDGKPGLLKWGGDAGMRDTRETPQKVKLVDLFSGPIALNAQGEADIPLNIPDFNGTLRLMAVAATSENYGNAEREMTVAAPIVAEIATPRFLAYGDNATIALDVTNLSGSAQNIKLKLAADALLNISEGQRELKLANKQRSILRFGISPKAPLGLSRITLELQGSGAKAISLKREFALQIQPPTPMEQDEYRYRIEPGGSKTLPPELIERFVKGSATLKLSLAGQAPFNVQSIVQGLLDYPYGCLEQTTSAAYPHVFIDEAGAKAVGLTPRSQAERARFIEGAIARIGGMQGSSGGYYLWGSSGDHYEQWLTPYVTGFLMDARDAGFNVPESMQQRAQQWMLERLNNSGNDIPNTDNLKSDANGRYRYADGQQIAQAHRRVAELAHMGYMLARQQKAPLASLRLLFDNHRQRIRSPLPLVHLGIALQLMGDQKRGQEAINLAMKQEYGIRFSDRDTWYNYWWAGDYGSAVRDNALAYSLMHRHKITHTERESLLFNVVDSLQGRDDQRYYYSTQERIALYLAARAANTSVGATWRAELQGPQGKQTLEGQAVQTRSLDAQATGYTLNNPGNSTLWVTVEARGLPLKPSASSDKFRLEREYFTLDGQPWRGNSLKTGEMLIARIKVKTGYRMDDALIVEQLPAGLEVENFNLSQGQKQREFVVNGENAETAMQDKRIQHREYRDDRFVAAVKLDGYQDLHLYYVVRAVTPGRFTIPATYAEDMYRPWLRGFGSESGNVLTVADPRVK